MPYKIKKVPGKGTQVTTPGHPRGFSRHPMSPQKAAEQLRAIKANTKGKE